jgi:hypothetical protein
MKLVLPQQLQRTDFPDAPNWISTLLYPLQLFQSQVVSALTNQLTVQDNWAAATNKLTFVAAASADLNQFQFIWPYARQPVMLVMHVTRTDGTYPTIYPVPSWNLVTGNIMVNGIQGLTTGVSYQIQTVVI